MRFAPSSELPPNLKATISDLTPAPASESTALGSTAPPKRERKSPSAGTSVGACSGLMVPLRICFRGSVSGGGLKKKTHRQVASGGGLETFAGLVSRSTRRKRK